MYFVDSPTKCVAKYEYMTVPENRSFISSTGSTWTNLTTKYEDTTVVSIKVTTDDVVDDNIYEFDEEINIYKN